MNLIAARRALRALTVVAAERALTKAERQKLVNVKARIRSLTNNHFSV